MGREAVWPWGSYFHAEPVSTFVKWGHREGPGPQRVRQMIVFSFLPSTAGAGPCCCWGSPWKMSDQALVWLL